MQLSDTLIYVVFLALVLGFIVFKRNPKSQENISYALICAGMALWVGGLYLFQITQSFYWPDKISLFGGMVMVGSFYVFSRIFPFDRKWNWVKLIPLLLLVALLPFNVFIKTVHFSEGGFVPENGALFPVYAVVCGGYIIATLRNFYWQYLNNIGYKRQRIMYVILSLAVFLVVALVCDVLLPVFNIASLKFFGPLSSTLFLSLSAWSIVSYNLMDIRLVLKTVLVNIFTLILVILILVSFYGILDVKVVSDNQLAGLIIFGAIMLFLFLREVFDWLFGKFFLKGYTIFKDSFDELNAFLQEETNTERLILLGNKYFKRGLRLSWVYYYDLEKSRLIFAPNESPFESNHLTIQQAVDPSIGEYLWGVRSIKFLYGAEFQAFSQMSNFPIALMPLWNKGILKGYFVLGPQMTLNGMSFEETHRLKYSWAHMETAFDRALLYEGLEQKVQAQVEDIEFKNKTLKELLQNRLDFIQVTSHQLRTPLTALSGALEVLFSGSSDSEESREMIKIANEKAKALSNVITGTLNIARLEQQDAETLSEYVNLNEVFAGLLPIIEAAARAKGIALEFEPIARVEVSGNKLYLEQAFFNILENAVQHTDAGKVKIYFVQAAGTITTCISDTGLGIEPEIMNKVFNRNVFGLNSRGLGLGLYIVKTIIEEHPGGKVWFETSPGGTTFFVQLQKYVKG